MKAGKPFPLTVAMRVSMGSDGIFYMELRDRDNAIRFFEAKMTPEDYAMMVGASREITVKAEFQGVELLGSKLELKTEFVPSLIEATYHVSDADVRDHLASFETDGWRASRSDFGNSHRSKIKDGVRGYTVGFRRYVDSETGEPIEHE